MLGLWLPAGGRRPGAGPPAAGPVGALLSHRMRPFSGLGLLAALTCRPKDLPRAGVAFRAGLRDYTSPSPACRILVLSGELAHQSGQLLSSRSVDVLVPRRSSTLLPLARHWKRLSWRRSGRSGVRRRAAGATRAARAGQTDSMLS